MRTLFLTDKQVAAILGINKSTLSRWANQEAPVKHGIRLADAEPFYIGKSRRWNPSRLARVIGVGVDEIIKDM